MFHRHEKSGLSSFFARLQSQSVISAGNSSSDGNDTITENTFRWVTSSTLLVASGDGTISRLSWDPAMVGKINGGLQTLPHVSLWNFTNLFFVLLECRLLLDNTFTIYKRFVVITFHKPGACISRLLLWTRNVSSAVSSALSLTPGSSRSASAAVLDIDVLSTGEKQSILSHYIQMAY